MWIWAHLEFLFLPQPIQLSSAFISGPLITSLVDAGFLHNMLLWALGSLRSHYNKFPPETSGTNSARHFVLYFPPPHPQLKVIRHWIAFIFALVGMSKAFTIPDLTKSGTKSPTWTGCPPSLHYIVPYCASSLNKGNLMRHQRGPQQHNIWDLRREKWGLAFKPLQH